MGKKQQKKSKHEQIIKVLVVEDEDSFVEALTIGLKHEGFTVTVARDGAEALEIFDQADPDLVLLDLMLPLVSGLDVCREIRTKSSVPIIMVTAKGEEIDTVVGLEIGADDYVVKPYRLRELVARMRAVLRRHPEESDGEETSQEVIERANVRLEPSTRRAFVLGEEIHLRRKEFELLRLLMENPGRVLTRQTLIDQVWGDDYVGDTKTLDVHIMRLRNRIETDPNMPSVITTIRGVGYRFDAN
jgi:two-component system, OmpR family, response regulator RegX3